MTIVANGGIGTLEEIDLHMSHVDGVMLGRAAYQNPFILAMIDRFYFDSSVAPRSRRDVGLEMLVLYRKRNSEWNASTRDHAPYARSLPGITRCSRLAPMPERKSACNARTDQRYSFRYRIACRWKRLQSPRSRRYYLSAILKRNGYIEKT